MQTRLDQANVPVVLCRIRNAKLVKQHHEIVLLIARLEELDASGGLYDNYSVMDRLVDLTQNHFAYEEFLLDIRGFSRLAKVQKEHEKIVEVTLEFYKKFYKGLLDFSTETIGFLRKWWVEHLLIDDEEYITALSLEHPVVTTTAAA